MMPDRVQTKLNLRRELRQRLELEADKSGRSINGEVEYRLERSFTDEELRTDVQRLSTVLEVLIDRAYK